MDDVELRYALLEKARSVIFNEWEQRVRVEEAVARFENRPPVVIRPPTLHRVMVLAEKFYGFVKTPPLIPTNPLSKPLSLDSDSPEDSSSEPESGDTPEPEGEE
jgi:hypothetical protein